ncbi:molybdopterin molybdotransferase MoeA [Telmatobacter sp. DSM 110680]|uniref:Molybdopterin molybdenumtransferase n=1 Tax=Telmatobacter sp. DSM 110680 TaxID=3036704 RepID=A0AAU7DMN2_9BACT
MGDDLLSYEQAAELVACRARDLAQRRPATERVDLADAAGRILAAAVAADDDQPPFARSTRDGYACRVAEASAHLTLPVAGLTHAGEAPPAALPAGKAWEIMTGAPVPAGADCVVMLEYVERVGDTIRLVSSRRIEARENIVAKGAQSRRGDVLLKPGTKMGAAQIALAASCGYARLEVYVRPRVAILTTGDELVPVDATPGPGKIRNSNAPMLAALVAHAGGDPVILPTAADTAEALDDALELATQADILLISGGVSAGKFDLVEPALARLDSKIFFTGIRIQPGKPLVFGEIASSGLKPYINRPRSEGHFGPAPIPVFGLPGNPISSAATFHLFAAPILAALAGSNEIYPRFVLAELSQATDRKGRPGLTRFLPARCEFNASVNELPKVALVPWHGSGDLTAFAQSNCFVVIPEDKGSLEAGSMVRILLH